VLGKTGKKLTKTRRQTRQQHQQQHEAPDHDAGVGARSPPLPKCIPGHSARFAPDSRHKAAVE